MEKLIRFIKIDIVIQIVLIFLVCITGVVLFPLMITLPTLGAWQLFSAIVIGISLNDAKRKNYLFSSIAYLGLMYLAFYLTNYYRSSHDFLLGIMFIPIPFGIAIWYFIETKRTLKKLEKQGIIEMPETMENILDSEEIFKIIKNS